MTRSISQGTLTKVLDVIKQEADMDGVATVTDTFIANQASLDPITVFFAVHTLIHRDKLKELGRAGRRHTRVLQVEDYQ